MKLERMNQQGRVLDRWVDVGVVTTIASEVEAIFEVFGIDQDKDTNIAQPLDYWEASVFSPLHNRDLRVVLTLLSGTAGNPDSGITAAFSCATGFRE